MVVTRLLVSASVLPVVMVRWEIVGWIPVAGLLGSAVVLADLEENRLELACADRGWIAFPDFAFGCPDGHVLADARALWRQ